MPLRIEVTCRLLLVAGLVGCSSAPGSGPMLPVDGGTAVTATSAGLVVGDTVQPVKTQSLFNGTDLANWDRYLGSPLPSEPPLGLENDPYGVYSVVPVDGEPAIRISGEVWGSLISEQEYCDFELRLDFKWGSKVWPPLNAFDSGIMVMSTGPYGAVNAGGSALSDPIGSGSFLVSVEYQLYPGDIGSMYNLGPTTFSSLPKNPVLELTNDWNHVTIVHRNGVLTFSLNDQQLTKGSGFGLSWPGEPARTLSCGKIQLQSEGGEIFFRNVELDVFD